MLFSDIVFGPIKSRRLGLSLGVNLLPTESKICNFDCIYCECGWNGDHRGAMRFNDKDQVVELLQQTLRQMVSRGETPDVITFAGNGEPTLHPDFEQIISRCIEVRDAEAPTAKISVLSNATRIHIPSVARALQLVDNNILKIDAVDPALAHIMNQPQGDYSVERVVDAMMQFEGQATIQTMLLRGEYQGVAFDNTLSEHIDRWLDIVARVKPRNVMLYSLDRTPPCSTLQRVEREEMESIAQRVRELGVECSVA